MPERDTQNILKDKIDYEIGIRGVEPKLKCKIEPLKGSPSSLPVSLASFLDCIILGPSLSSVLAVNSFRKMVKKINPEFEDKVFASSIPLRPSR